MKKIIAVGSGKGGVGKSTAAVNIAVALANQTYPGAKPLRVALIDVDFYGPSVPILMGAKLDGTEIRVDHQQKIIPPVSHGVKYISIGFFLQQPDQPIVWRGPRLDGGVRQLFHDVNWGEVDVYIVDVPPGTGDILISLSQQFKMDGAVLVTTPQEVSVLDVRRALNAFRKVNVPILGVIENMSALTLPSGEKLEVFGAGGGRHFAEQYNVDFLGEVPLEMSVRQGGDVGKPCVLESNSVAGGAFSQIAARIVEILDRGASSSPVIED